MGSINAEYKLSILCFGGGMMLAYLLWGSCSGHWFSLSDIFGLRDRSFFESLATKFVCGRTPEDVRRNMLAMGIIGAIGGFIYGRYKHKF